jgi:hypothetical protein
MKKLILAIYVAVTVLLACIAFAFGATNYIPSILGLLWAAWMFWRHRPYTEFLYFVALVSVVLWLAAQFRYEPMYMQRPIMFDRWTHRVMNCGASGCTPWGS